MPMRRRVWLMNVLYLNSRIHLPAPQYLDQAVAYLKNPSTSIPLREWLPQSWCGIFHQKNLKHFRPGWKWRIPSLWTQAERIRVDSEKQRTDLRRKRNTRRLFSFLNGEANWMIPAKTSSIILAEPIFQLDNMSWQKNMGALVERY